MARGTTSIIHNIWPERAASDPITHKPEATRYDAPAESHRRPCTHARRHGGRPMTTARLSRFQLGQQQSEDSLGMRPIAGGCTCCRAHSSPRALRIAGRAAIRKPLGLTALLLVVALAAAIAMCAAGQWPSYAPQGVPEEAAARRKLASVSGDEPAEAPTSSAGMPGDGQRMHRGGPRRRLLQVSPPPPLPPTPPPPYNPYGPAGFAVQFVAACSPWRCAIGCSILAQLSCRLA